MAITRMKNSGIKTGQLKYDSALGGLPPVMAAPTATAGDASASVAFTTISGATSYTVISSPGSITATGTSSPITITGLTNATAYTFQIKATNSVGDGPYSTASNSVTPVGAYTLATTINATTNWTVPSGKNQIAVYLWGGGSAGTSGAPGNAPGGFLTGGNGGGGSASLLFYDYAVTPGTTYLVTIGAGGVGNNGSSGGVSSFGNTTPYLANSGDGSSNGNVVGPNSYITASYASYGTGGTSNGNNTSGTAGNAGTNAYSLVPNSAGLNTETFGGGGGGGGGGATRNLNSGSNSGGSSGAGGTNNGATGGNGGNASGNTGNGNSGGAGQAGTQPGGGGGGGGAGAYGRINQGSGGSAGAGGAGRVIIYTR